MSELHFRLEPDAPTDVREQFKKVYDDIISDNPSKFNPYLIIWVQELENHNIGTDMDRQVLNRAEGGIGGDNNRTNRQLRFFNNGERSRKFGEVTLISLPSDDGSCMWNMEDLNEFGNAFLNIFPCTTHSYINFYITDGSTSD